MNTISERVAAAEQKLADYIEHHKDIHRLQIQEVITRATEINRRLDEMNQFRAQINSERGEFLSRESYDAHHDAIVQRVSLLEIANSNMQGRMYMTGALISVFVSVVVVAVNLIVKLWK